jgi:glycosyltransferase involved in cell wall biosynthesis
MKILIGMDTLHPVVEIASKGLRFRGHEVIVITSVQDESQAGEDLREGVRFIRIHVPPSRYFETWQTIYNYKAIKAFKGYVKSFCPDVVHLHGVHFFFSYGLIPSIRPLVKKVFFTFHSTFAFTYFKLQEFIDFNDLRILNKFYYKVKFWDQFLISIRTRNPFRNLMIRSLLNGVDKRFAVSAALRDSLEQNGIKPVSVLYNGLDVERVLEPMELVSDWKRENNFELKQLIIFGGRLCGEKGLEYLLDSFEKVSVLNSNAYLLIIGSGHSEYVERIKRIIRLKGIDTHVMLFSWMSHSQFQLALQAADLVVVPSVYLDPLPTITLEAMLLKKPVIGSCFGGIPEMITDDFNGVIVNPIDTSRMTQEIIGLLSDSELSKKYGDSGFERVKERFSLETHLDILESIYYG